MGTATPRVRKSPLERPKHRPGDTVPRHVIRGLRADLGSLGSVFLISWHLEPLCHALLSEPIFTKGIPMWIQLVRVREQPTPAPGLLTCSRPPGTGARYWTEWVLREVGTALLTLAFPVKTVLTRSAMGESGPGGVIQPPCAPLQSAPAR
ncbi:hypothetical protein NDU88_004445 [Pleurodeles waltl]|uniref:Uncharacterized protein n=1 Tax=Pleurodeles waltl TaxID=8319 RepID=A0AAV7MTK3_PLEWA|nr:hypothetical protein NDU88_004445 [Pleurodeles waltl]